MRSDRRSRGSLIGCWTKCLGGAAVVCKGSSRTVLGGSPDGVARHDIELLREVGDLHGGLCLDDLAAVRLQRARDELQLRRLARTIDACDNASAYRAKRGRFKAGVMSYYVPRSQLHLDSPRELPRTCVYVCKADALRLRNE